MACLLQTKDSIRRPGPAGVTGLGEEPTPDRLAAGSGAWDSQSKPQKRFLPVIGFEENSGWESHCLVQSRTDVCAL